jgi:hypothetical protein
VPGTAWDFDHDAKGLRRVLSLASGLLLCLRRGRDQIHRRKDHGAGPHHGLRSIKVGRLADIREDHVVAAASEGLLQVRTRRYRADRVAGFFERRFEIGVRETLASRALRDVKEDGRRTRRVSRCLD